MEGQGSEGRQSESGSNSAGKMKDSVVTGSKGRGRPRRLPFSPVVSRKLGVGLDIGHDVVVRWSDGLLFRGQVLRVDEANDRCQVKFDDGSTFYVVFKDIHKVPGQGEPCCCVCKGETNEAPNRIIQCDSCGMGFHQSCHNPPIVSSGMPVPANFFCKLCTFSAVVKHGSPMKCSTPVSAKDDIKQILPYKMNILTWDAQHRTNVEQCYCYCGGPGDWYCKMLQCCRCRQWFHEVCLQCLQHPLLYGDRFYMFVCSHCNHGQEYLKRLPFKWMDVAHIALFNLTLCYTHKYYDLDDTIMPWVADHQQNLEISNLFDGKSVNSPEVRNKVESALMGHKSKFTSGREVKKKCTLWALILRIPPNAPSVTIPLSGVVNADIMNNPSLKGRKMKHIIPTQCQSPIPLKYPSRSSLDRSLSIMFQNASARKVIPEANNNVKVLTNGFSANQCYNGYNGMHREVCSNGHASAHYSSSSESGEEEDRVQSWRRKKTVLRTLRRSSKSAQESVQCKLEPPSPVAQKITPSSTPRSTRSSKSSNFLLDRLVPQLPNFDGMNHPFRTEIEKEKEKSRVRHFEARVAFLKKEYAGELDAFKLAQATKQSNNNTMSQDRIPPTKSPSNSPEQKQRKGMKRKHSSSVEKDISPKDTVRRSKRSRMNAERYQHLLDSFPRHMPKPDPSEGPLQRWKWLSVMDQLRYGEKFHIQARRTGPGGRVEFLLHWNDDGELPMDGS